MAEKLSDVNNVRYLMISNIPSDYHSKDLRNYFSQFLETGGFKCFHFRHRPEKADASKKKCCCIIRVCLSRLNELFRLYNRKHWLDKNGDSLSTICFITQIRDVESLDDGGISNALSPKYKTNKEQLQIPTDREEFTLSDLLSLPELLPPAVMPNGNVGTPTLMFLDSIKQCRLPPSIIGKLGLAFPMTRARRIYSSVPFKYCGETMGGRELDDIPAVTASGHEIVDGETEDTLEIDRHMIDSRPTLLPDRMEIVGNSVIHNKVLPDRSEIGKSSVPSRTDTVLVSCDGSRTSINMLPVDNLRAQGTCIHKNMSRLCSICDRCNEPCKLNSYKSQMTSNCSISHETTSSTCMDSNPETNVCINSKHRARTGADSHSNDQLISDLSKKKPSKQKHDKQNTCPALHAADAGIEERHGAGARSGAESEDDADSCEEWERHEALYDDPANQERNKERLFEEKIEVKWDKGGSGLVFYTDAQYWDEQEGDFDEKTTDDWDVDMSVYYEQNAGDKDAKDYITMRKEAFLRKDRKRKRADDNDSDDGSRPIGRFERYTKGFGRRLMEKSGWKDGKGLGSWKEGMAIALNNDGQHPRSKAGLGYRGEKLKKFKATRSSIPSRPKRRDIQDGEIHISTAFDKPDDTDPPEKLLRRNPPTVLKHR